tara:strand:- start:1342 stop:2712 length:1371 start_codon:yes stop_codon:yes gene_type:complete
MAKPRVAILVAHNTACRAFLEVFNTIGFDTYAPLFNDEKEKTEKSEIENLRTINDAVILDNFPFQCNSPDKISIFSASLTKAFEAFDFLVDNFDYILTYHPIHPLLNYLFTRVNETKSRKVKKIFYLLWGEASDDCFQAYRFHGQYLNHSARRESSFVEPEQKPEQTRTWNFFVKVSDVLKSPKTEFLALHDFVQKSIGLPEIKCLPIPLNKFEDFEDSWYPEHDKKICIIQSRLYQMPHVWTWLYPVVSELGKSGYEFYLIGKENTSYKANTHLVASLLMDNNVKFKEFDKEEEVFELMKTCKMLIHFPQKRYSAQELVEISELIPKTLKLKDCDKEEFTPEEAREALELICKTCNADFLQKTPRTQLQYSVTQACGIGLPVLSFEHSAFNTHFTKSDVEDLVFKMPYEIKSKVENICSKTNEELKELTKSQKKVYEIYKQENIINQYSKFFNNE